MSKKIKPLTGKFSDFSGIILKAAASGHLAAVKKYVKFQPDWLNQIGPHGRTLLWEAAYKGRTETVKWLIDKGADVSAIGSYYTPMHVELSAIAAARAAGHTETVELLKANGAKDDFYAACHRGDIFAMKRFVSRKKSIINTPIFDLPAHPRMGYHPIHYAVVGGHFEAVKFLIDNGAKVAQHMPLLLDWSELNRSVISPLIRKQAKKENPSSIRTKKRKAGVPTIDQPDWMGFPALVDACRGNHNATDDPARVRSLLQRGANINVTDHKGKTGLHRAAQAGFLRITQLLIDSGANTEIADQKQQTPIYDAIAYGRIETVRLLLKNRVNMEHQDYRGETPIFAAARGKSSEVFEVLVKAKAKLTHENSKGNTLFDILGRKRNSTVERQKMLDFLKKIEQETVNRRKS